MDREQAEKKHVVTYHASPCGYQPETEYLCADICSGNAHAPHSEQALDKRRHCLSDALHDTL